MERKKTNNSIFLPFADIHCHILWNMDDGAKDVKMTLKMLQMAYQDGIRQICFTPHFRPDCFFFEEEQYQSCKKKMTAYLCKKYPDMQVVFGQEIYMDANTVSFLQSGMAKTLGSSSYVLVEYEPSVLIFTMKQTLGELQKAGYYPILAHVERYQCIQSRWSLAKDLAQTGVLLQANANAVLGKNGIWTKRILHHMLKENLISFVATDAHNLTIRKPHLNTCYQYVQAKYGKELADRIFYRNAQNFFTIFDQ